jgi:hypothetical protein
MATIFNKIFVTKAEYSIIKTMHVSEQLRWLFDTYDSTTKQTGIMDLSAFFKDVKDELEQYNNALPMHVEEIDIKETALPADSNIDFVDVMIDDENIMIESNSLRAVKHIALTFAEAGYILARDRNMEKMFKKDKVTRYMRIFKIISQVSTICLN